ncbi:MAG: V-type ATP synthase subunit E family protein [Candidatus Omnitrophota bacterium]
MTDKTLYSKVKMEDAQEICKRIIDDASSQADTMLSNANKEKSRMIEEANLEADAKRKDILKNSELGTEKTRQKIFSTLNLEKKKLFLEEKGRFIEAVFEKVRLAAEEFRENPGYKAFLEKAIKEGIDVIGGGEAEVLYSTMDERIIKDDIMKNIKDSAIQFKKSDFKDIGVIVRSKDSRLIYDNTFSARFKRMRDEIYMELLKGVS